MNEKKINYFSMFTGIGGFELGISKGSPHLECVGFSEIDKAASKLLENKYPNIKNYGDATKINPSKLPNFDMLCGGFPCQAFSTAGHRKGFDDTRGTLFFEVARIAKVKKPKIIFLENVKGLLNHDNGKTFSKILSTLWQLGYNIQWMVFNSRFFGVPQNRERVFIIANLRNTTRPELLPFNAEFKIHETEQKLSNRQKIGREDFGEERIQKGNADKFGQPRNAITRRLTPLECERVQGFPDNWTEGFSNMSRYQMLGNAVTVNVIEAISRCLGRTVLQP